MAQLEKINDVINRKIDFYKQEREVLRKQQKSYNWTREERVNGSERYGRLQEKEDVFSIKIFELEFALGCINYKYN